jgi:hypothetical protein
MPCAITPASAPTSSPERPDVLLHMHVEATTALISLDFSGESLHQRGYREEGGRAPLKENVAAADTAACRVGRGGSARRLAGRSNVRVRDVPDRSRTDRCGHCAGVAARIFWISRLARSRRRIVAGAARRGRTAPCRACRCAVVSSARTSMARRCAWRLPMAKAPGSLSGCTWRSGRWLRS